MPRALAQEVAPERGEIDVAFTYAANHGNSTAGTGFWMQGGGGEVAGHFGHGLAAVASVSGYHVGAHGSTVPLSLLTPVFGPRYTWHAHSLRKDALSLFGQVLAGEAIAFGGTFPAGSGAVSSASSLAIQIGGGVEVALSRHVALRAAELEWLRTSLPNATTGVQNNLRVSGGVVFRFGRR